MAPGQVAPDYRSEPALFHLGLSATQDATYIRSTFRDVKFILLGGTTSRAMRLGEAYLSLAEPSRPVTPGDKRLANICSTGRYYLARPDSQVLVAAHGIGRGSADTLLHELTSLLRLAGAVDPAFLRSGSCGGCGVAPGTVVVTSRVVDARARPALHTTILGRPVMRPARVCPKLAAALTDKGRDLYGDDGVRMGTTMCCDAFYEEQARLDGAFCEYSLTEQQAFLRDCRNRHGVLNFEMESMALAAFCTRAHVRCAVVCAALVDRLDISNGDTPTASLKQIMEWESRPVRLVAQYVYQQLQGVDA